MATTVEFPDRQSLPTSPSSHALSHEYDLPSDATSTRERIDFEPLPPPSLPLPPPSLYLASSMPPRRASPNSSAASPSTQRQHDDVHRPDNGSQPRQPIPRPKHRDARSTSGIPPKPKLPPPPSPPPPGGTLANATSPQPPPPPPPPPPYTGARQKGALIAPIRSLSPSMSFSSGSWPHDFTSSDSGASSEVSEDIFEQQNRAFPPLMPTFQARKAVKRERRQIIDVITHKVSRLKHSRSSVPSLESDSFSVASAASSDDDIQKLWTEMKERRQKVNTIKQEMASRRRVLRELRRRKDEADNAFMNMVRPILVRGRRGTRGPLEEVLDERFTEMQSLRTKYHWQESGYEGLEVTLDEEEEDLNNIETRFFSQLAAGSSKTARAVHAEDSEDEPEDQSNMPYELLGISRHGPPEDTHPLWRDLVSAIGDLNNAKDEYDDLIHLHGQYVYDIGVKKSVGKDLSAEEVEFMNDFPEEEREKRENLDHLGKEVARLRQTCEEKGAMKKHPSFRIAYALNPDIGEDMSLDDVPPASSLAHDQFADLLSSADNVLRDPPLTALGELKQAAMLPAEDPMREARLYAAQKEFGISGLISKSRAEDKPDFITRWLLHHLRTSPLAVEVLYTTFVHTLRLKIENRKLWQQDVLFHWWRDGAVRSAEDFFGPLTGSGMVSPENEVLVQASVPVEGAQRSPASSMAATEGGGRVSLDKMNRTTEVFGFA